jgi:hypothetical protein
VTTPVAADTVGVNEYALPAVTLAAGTPLSTMGVTVVSDTEEVEVIEPLAVLVVAAVVAAVPLAAVLDPLLPSKQPERVAVSTKPTMMRNDISNFPLRVPLPQTWQRKRSRTNED